MKRLFLLLLGLGLAAAIGGLGWNIWETTRYFEAQGREATLVIGKRYNAERWMSPVPLKKIYTYTAKLEPKYEVLVETDQDIKEGERRQIRFLTRDLAGGLTDYSIRPVSNALRLRGADDGTPVKIEDSALFDQLVDKWMGPPAEGVYIRPRAMAEAAPTQDKPTVPFVFTSAGDGTWDIIWTNSRAQEWLLLGLGLLCVQSLLIAAYDRQKDSALAKKRAKNFVHPSLRKIDADAADTPSKKLTYVPRPDEEIVLSDSEKRRRAEATANPVAPSAPVTPPAQPAATAADISGAGGAVPPGMPDSTPVPAAPLANEPDSLAGRETAPPMPIARDVVLKLRRKADPDKPADGA